MTSEGAFVTFWKFLHTHVIRTATARKRIITRNEGSFRKGVHSSEAQDKAISFL